MAKIDYVTESEVRMYCGIASQEYTSANVMTFASMAMGEIDSRTGRTWTGIASVTNEYYTGDGSDTLYLNRTDVWELCEISIDDDDDGTFTTVTPSNVKVYQDEGILVLKNSAEVTIFPSADRSIKVNYTHGAASASVPNDIKMLCLKVIANMIHPNDVLSRAIDRDIKSNGALGTRLI